MEKTERQRLLLQAIVQQYIKTARPVSSNGLAEEYGFDFSSATIRSDMASLEEAGLIRQPHTSSGRVPTEQGYQYYIEHFLRPAELAQQHKDDLSEVVRHSGTTAQHIQQLAKTVASLSNEAVIVSFDGEQTFYTGMSHMFRQPEFSEDAELMVSVGDAFDRVDDMMHKMHELVSPDVQILVGRENPLSHKCSIVFSEYTPDGERSLIVSIFGPMRMNYDRNVAILEYMEQLMHANNDRER